MIPVFRDENKFGEGLQTKIASNETTQVPGRYCISKVCSLVNRFFEDTPTLLTRDPCNLAEVLKMLAVMEPNPEPSQDPVSEFLVTGRTGRRNAMADILGPHATTSSGDLPERLQTLCTAESEEGSSTASQGQGESKPENPNNVATTSVKPGEQLQPRGNS